MPTCPNCGSVVMEGDPYCSHCGAHFRWSPAIEEDDTSLGFDSCYREPASYDSYVHDPVKGEVFLDFGEVSETYTGADEDTLEYIAGSICATSTQKLQLKARIRQYWKAPDFRGFYIRKDYEFEVYYFHFIQENEYVKTTHVMTYRQDSDYFPSPYKAFYESYSQHNHDGLTANPRFRKLVESTGLEFDGCGGGYESCLKNIGDDVELTDKIEVRVYFKVEAKRRVYQLDLDEMKLSSDYYEYDLNG